MKDSAAGIITDNVSYFKAISAIRHKGPLNALRLFKLPSARFFALSQDLSRFIGIVKISDANTFTFTKEVR